MKNLLQEAIIDAKAVKDTAIANAKLALEESLTPFLREKFSAKLEEMDSEVEETELDLESLVNETNKKKDDDKKADKKAEDEAEISLEDMTEEDLTSFIEDVIKDMVDAGELEAGEETEIDAEMDADAEVNDADAEMDDIAGAEMDADAEAAEAEGAEIAKENNSEEEIDISELFNDISEDETEEVDVNLDELFTEAETEVKKETELEEALATINELRTSLQETNLFNIKLLYTNKIFKAKNLTEAQKLKVLGSFDKATSKKEASFIYETLMDSLKTKTPIVNESIKGMASKIIAGPINNNTKKTTIIESNQAFARMQELAFGGNK